MTEFPDWQTIMLQWLVARPNFDTRIAGGLHPNEFPANRSFPCARIVLLSDEPITTPRWAVNALVQVDVVAASPSTAWRAAEFLRANLAADFNGVITTEAGSLVAGRPDVGGIRRGMTKANLADPTGTPSTTEPRHTARFDVVTVLHPQP